MLIMGDEEALVEARKRWGGFAKELWEYAEDDIARQNARQGFVRTRNGRNGKRECVVGYEVPVMCWEDESPSCWIETLEYEQGCGDTWERAFAEADKKGKA